MLSSITGVVQLIENNMLTIQSGPFGFLLHVARPEQHHKDQTITLVVHMHWNQDQGPTLFGFLNSLDKKIFLLITSCSGIGPKIALSIMNQLESNAFLHAIQSGDDKALSQVNGIGKKKAEQMVVQLRDKVCQLIDSGQVVADEQSGLEQWSNLTQVLKSLNYSSREIALALEHVRVQQQGANGATFDQLLRSSLSFLAKKV